jgi:hypothetical protein
MFAKFINSIWVLKIFCNRIRGNGFAFFIEQVVLNNDFTVMKEPVSLINEYCIFVAFNEHHPTTTNLANLEQKNTFKPKMVTQEFLKN